MTDSMPLPRPIHLEELTPLVGEIMIADCDPNPVELQLVEASPLVNHAKLDRPPFILVFRSSLAAQLVPGAYVMRGKRFGPDLIDIARTVTPNTAPPGHYYQAVFN